MATFDVNNVQTLTFGNGELVIPDASLYEASSDHWREEEHHASLANTRSQVAAWRGEPGWVRITDWPYHEICVIQKGRVAIEDQTGGRREFGPGEAFVVPAGFNGVWHTLEASEKIFIGIQPDSPASA
ncbi:cupin domain-containing protein [Paenarthrobacter sp. NPDC090520]|uniref:cupin domain-containing protein n=1 Tax=Paenarthrobacter sp. NPDC090520 TaxID=3364382 RepID=UPI003827E5AB